MLLKMKRVKFLYLFDETQSYIALPVMFGFGAVNTQGIGVGQYVSRDLM